MKKSLPHRLLIAASVLMISQPAHALFVNGGFETGDTTGWTITGDNSVISSYTAQFNTTTNWNSVPAWYGQYSLLLGSPAVGNERDNHHSSSAMQIGSISQEDIDNGAHLYFKWGALLEEPTNVYHANSQQPAFSIDILQSTDSGASWTSLYAVNHRANEGGWTSLGTNATGDAGVIWGNSAVINLDLASLSLGTLIKLDLSIADCGQGGHGGLVMLDGFGTTEINPVPEPATLLLMGIGLASLAGFWGRKKA